MMKEEVGLNMSKLWDSHGPIADSVLNRNYKYLILRDIWAASSRRERRAWACCLCLFCDSRNWRNFWINFRTWERCWSSLVFIGRIRKCGIGSKCSFLCRKSIRGISLVFYLTFFLLYFLYGKEKKGNWRDRRNNGSGKTTQINLLIGKLKLDGFKIKTIHFPKYDNFFGGFIGHCLTEQYYNFTNVWVRR